MQILDIVLYGGEGRVRRIGLRTGQLNIITGASKTGKSALSNIVEYCLGRNDFLVPAGVIANNVLWYGLRLQFPSTQVFIARRAPAKDEKTSGAVYMTLGAELEVPSEDKLEKNTNTKDMREKLTRMLDISPNLNVPDEDETRRPLESTISHALLLNFQQQGEVDAQHILFHRQSEATYMPQTIKDTLPYFLGAVAEGWLAKTKDLRRAKRALALAEKRQREAELLRGEGLSRGQALLAEAEDVGLITSGAGASDADALKRSLAEALEWEPLGLPAVPGDAMTRLAEERSSLLSEYRTLKDRIRATEKCAEGQELFTSEVREQQARLQAVGLYPEPSRDVAVCPLCESVLETPPPLAADMQGALARLSAQLNSVAAERPRLRERIDLMKDELQEVGGRLDANRLASKAVAEQQPSATEVMAFNARASQVVGKIAFYLENMPEAEGGTALEEEITQAKRRIKELEEELANANTAELLPSILNNISKRIGMYAEQLGLEYSTAPLRLDMTNLTIVADTDEAPVPLARMGSAANWVGYHLVTHLALHQWFIQKNRPVPRFLFLDQPSQAYYPEDESPAAVEAALESDTEGSLTFLEDDDREAVKGIFKWLHEAVAALAPDFQIIVTDHADINEPWFRDAVVQRWRGGEKLIPQEWLL